MPMNLWEWRLRANIFAGCLKYLSFSLSCFTMAFTFSWGLISSFQLCRFPYLYRGMPCFLSFLELCLFVFSFPYFWPIPITLPLVISHATFIFLLTWAGFSVLVLNRTYPVLFLRFASYLLPYLLFCPQPCLLCLNLPLLYLVSSSILLHHCLSPFHFT